MNEKDWEKLGTIVRKIVNEEVGSIVDENLKPVKLKINKIDKKLDALIRVYDKEHQHVNNRLDRIEEVLELPELAHKI